MTVDTANWVGLLLAGGRYQVTDKLGAGGMGYVYRAYDRNLDCEVVIKVPRLEMTEKAEFAGRFSREIRSLVKLVHPHVVKVTDVGEHESSPFAVMQYLSGGSLRDRQRKNADGKALPLRPEELTDWLDGVAAALDFIHQQGYMHRDIKPDNILFDAHGNVYLSDFGVAKVLADTRSAASRTAVTGTGVVLGTPEYMAPELIMGQPCDGRVDQYALGVLVYELLAGRPPFAGRTPAAILVMHTTHQLQQLREAAPGIAVPLSDAVHRSLAKDPTQRFPDCAAFVRAVLGKRDTVAKTGGRQTVACPACKKAAVVADQALGKRVRCPACQVVFVARPAGPSVAAETNPAMKVRTDTLAAGIPSPGPAELATAAQLPVQQSSGPLPPRRRTFHPNGLLVAGILSVVGVALLAAWTLKSPRALLPLTPSFPTEARVRPQSQPGVQP